jgi:hypothetical protein
MSSDDETEILETKVVKHERTHERTVGRNPKPTKKAAKSDIEHYFGQLTGTEEPDLEIVKPKIERLAADISTIITNMSTFSPAVRSLGYADDAVALDTFTSQAEQFHTELKSLYMGAKTLNGESWNAIKGHDFLQMCMVTCANLSIIHRQFVQSWDTVDKKFMNRFSGLQFTPFMPWCKIDFKHLWLIDGEHSRDLPELLFTVMKNLFNAMRDMYDVYMSPDVNISNLSELIISSLGMLRKRIPRCDKAFNKIEESARMLKDNFGEYYRDFLQTKDPNNIFTAFISDVSTSCGNDTMLILQCRKIVEYYKKNAQMKIASGEITGEKRKMFESLLNNYRALDKNASESGLAVEDKSAISESDESDDAASAADVAATEMLKEDERDLDELMAQIENPKVLSISGGQKPGKKK